jgi:hypothetical protein
MKSQDQKISMDANGAKSWFTYKTGNLTVLKWCPVLKVHFAVILLLLLMSATIIMIGLDPSNAERIKDPLVRFDPPRDLEINIFHPLFLSALVIVFVVSLIQILSKLIRQLMGRAIILGQKKVFVRGLSKRPIRWQDLQIEQLRSSASLGGLLLSFGYKGKRTSLSEHDFYLHDIKYLRDAMEWTRPDLKRREEVRQMMRSKKSNRPHLPS